VWLDFTKPENPSPPPYLHIDQEEGLLKSLPERKEGNQTPRKGLKMPGLRVTRLD